MTSLECFKSQEIGNGFHLLLEAIVRKCVTVFLVWIELSYVKAFPFPPLHLDSFLLALPPSSNADGDA